MNAEDWNQTNLETNLASLPLGRILFFSSVASTNDIAARLVSEGAPDLTLVVAGQQTAGKGRAGRKWFSPPGASIALSLALRPQQNLADSQDINSLLLRYTALSALAVCDALRSLYQLSAEIKWPNDVLLKKRKVCGVLAEAHWLGNQLEAIILGIGINVFPQAIPPKKDLQFPATCIQEHVKQEISRIALLSQVIGGLIFWRSHIQSPTFMRSWEELLAFRHQRVKVVNQTPEKTEQIITGKIVGLDSEGRLVLDDSTGTRFLVQFGELQLRPV